jgi:hypothetical protein
MDKSTYLLLKMTLSKKWISAFCIIFTFSLSAYTQNKQFPVKIRSHEIIREKSPEFKQTYKKKGLLNKEEWQALIDERWGEGKATSQKLQIFDNYWNRIDQHYAGFQNLKIDWEAIKQKYRPEIETGVSRGRFCAILNHMSFILNEGHSVVYDKEVYNDVLEAGVPLLVADGGFFNDHFGASLTPLEDSTLLVYKAVENHPLGLEPGDRVLGYEGSPWKDLYKQLLSYELPMTTMYFGSHRQSSEHILLTAAGENWHLFDTLDVIKYGASDTVHFPTSLLAGEEMELIGAEQLPVANIPFPDFSQGNLITWGIVKGTDLGYIYTHSWHPNFNPERFETAVLDLMHNHKTKGLILDARMNDGGQPKYYNNGLRHLFNKDLYFLDAVRRSDPNDHFGFSAANSNWPGSYEYLGFKATPEIYDKPIAILTGPSAISAADFYVLTARKHPYARTFGKTTNGAFSGVDGSVDNFSLGSDWYVFYPNHAFYLLENAGQYLAHFSQGVDEEVWLEAKDVVNGEDTVVKRAIEWINNLSYAHDVVVDNSYIKPVTENVIISADVENPNDHNLSVVAYISLNDTFIVDSVNLNQVDSIWDAPWIAPEEGIYHISVKTRDSDAGTSQIIPNVAHFASSGPVKIDRFYVTGNDTIINPGDSKIRFDLFLVNKGATDTIKNVSINPVFLDPCTKLARIALPEYFDIAPGETKKGSRTMEISFADSCQGDAIDFALEIMSDGHVFWTDTLSVVVGLADIKQDLPTTYSLSQNFPNPFNPKTTISYQLPMTSDVDLSIYNLLGQKVVTLVNKKQVPGIYSVSWNAAGFSSGIYIYQLTSDSGYSESRKLLLVK